MEERKLNVSNTTYDCDLDILDFQIPWLHESRFTNCDICQKVLPIFELGNHRKHHFNSVEEKEVPLICPICGYQSNADLNLHSKIHFIIKCETYGKCEFCQKWYKIECFESQNIHKEFYCLAKLKTSSKQLRLVEKWTLNHKYKLSSTKIQLTFKSR